MHELDIIRSLTTVALFCSTGAVRVDLEPPAQGRIRCGGAQMPLDPFSDGGQHRSKEQRDVTRTEQFVTVLALLNVIGCGWLVWWTHAAPYP